MIGGLKCVHVLALVFVVAVLLVGVVIVPCAVAVAHVVGLEVGRAAALCATEW